MSKYIKYKDLIKKMKPFENHMFEVIVGEHIDFWRLEYWKWFFPHPNYEPTNNGRIHLFGNFYWRK